MDDAGVLRVAKDLGWVGVDDWFEGYIGPGTAMATLGALLLGPISWLFVGSRRRWVVVMRQESVVALAVPNRRNRPAEVEWSGSSADAAVTIVSDRMELEIEIAGRNVSVPVGCADRARRFIRAVGAEA